MEMGLPSSGDGFVRWWFMAPHGLGKFFEFLYSQSYWSHGYVCVYTFVTNGTEYLKENATGELL